MNKKTYAYPSQLPTIGKSMDNIGKDMGNIMQNVPHVVVGKPKKPGQPLPPEDPIVAKAKKWTLIVFTILILGTAAFLVIKQLIGRFF